ADFGGRHECMVVMDGDGSVSRVIEDVDFGRAEELVVSPAEPRVAITNHRNELLTFHIDDDERPTVADSSGHGMASGIEFSACGGWLAYAIPESSGTDNADENQSRSAIKLLEIETGRTVAAARRVLNDFGPSFDPEGDYLYFIGQREFEPVYD